MRKAICVGETVLDIILNNGKPQSANPGGSAFNSAISLGRAGIDTYFIGEIGRDEVGKMTKSFLTDNGVHPDCLREYPGIKSNISLAFLDSNMDARYSFYRDQPAEHLDFILPEIGAEDIVLMSSFFALTPALRGQFKKLLATAMEKGAIVYYDINFRPSHVKDLPELKEFIDENIASADIVRASSEDLMLVYGDEYYEPGCTCFLRTAGPGSITLKRGDIRQNWEVRPIKPVSTIGAGDSFNAGIVCGLITGGIKKKDLKSASWDEVVTTARTFSGECCMSMENYIPKR